MKQTLSNELKIFAKNLNILVVEDNKTLSNELSSFLKIFFKKVFNAYDGEEALNIYKKQHCDIVITDLNMPKKDGIELSREIRLLDKEQVILVLSGYIDTYVIQLIDIGVQGLMIKPYDMNDFLQKLLVQCENITFKKEFEKIKLNKTLEKNIKKKISTNEDEGSLEKFSTQLVQLSNTKESIDKYIETFNIDEEVDDTMWKHISEDILELNERFEDNINRLTLHGLNDSIKNELIIIFDKYHTSLNFLPKMEKFAFIFERLSILLEDINIQELDKKKRNSIDIFEFIYDDLINFFNLVFINKETRNLNYLTDSLSSSIEQLEFELGTKEKEEEDLEFF